MSIDHAALNAACFTAFGEAGTYTPSGSAAQSITVIREHNVDFAPGGAESLVVERRTVLHIRKTEIASPGRGDTCVVDGTTYTVDAVLSDDGHIVQAVAR